MEPNIIFFVLFKALLDQIWIIFNKYKLLLLTLLQVGKFLHLMFLGKVIFCHVGVNLIQS